MSQYTGKDADQTILKQGWLLKQGGSRGFGFKTWKRRWFVLTTSGLSYFKSDVEYMEGKDEYGYLHMDSQFELRDYPDKSGEFFTFVNATRVLLCRARTIQEKVEWMTILSTGGSAGSVQNLIKNLGRNQILSPTAMNGSKMSSVPISSSSHNSNNPVMISVDSSHIPRSSPSMSMVDKFDSDDEGLENDDHSCYDGEHYDNLIEAASSPIPMSGVSLSSRPSVSFASKIDSRSTISNSDDPHRGGATITGIPSSFSSPRCASAQYPATSAPQSVPKCLFPTAQSTQSQTRINRTTSTFYDAAPIPAFETTLKFHSRSTREGYMYKTGNNIQSLRARYFVLLPDRLEYYKSHRDRRPKGSIPLTFEGFSGPYESPEFPDLLDGEVGTVFGYNGPKEGETHPKPKDEHDIVPPIKATWCFHVRPQPNGRSYLIFTHSKSEMEAWLAAIHATKTVKVSFPKRVVATTEENISPLGRVSEILSNSESRLALLGMAKTYKQEGPVLLWIDIIRLIECPEGSREFLKASQDIYDKFMKPDAEHFLAFPDDLVDAIRKPLENYAKLLEQSPDKSRSFDLNFSSTSQDADSSISKTTRSNRIGNSGLRHELFHPLAAVVMFYIQQNLLDKFLLLDPGRVSDLAEEELGLVSSLNDFASIEFLFHHLVSVSAGNEAGADADFRQAFFLNYSAFTSARILKRFLFKAFEDAHLEYESEVTAIASRTIVVSLFQEWLTCYPRDFTRDERLDLFIWFRRWYVSVCTEEWASLELPTVVQKRLKENPNIDIAGMGLSPQSVLAIAFYNIFNMSPPSLGGAFEPAAFELSKITCLSRCDASTLAEIQASASTDILSKYPSLVAPDRTGVTSTGEFAQTSETSLISNSNISSKPTLFTPMHQPVKSTTNNDTSKAKWLLGFRGTTDETEDDVAAIEAATPTSPAYSISTTSSDLNMKVYFSSSESTTYDVISPKPIQPQPPKSQMPRAQPVRRNVPSTPSSRTTASFQFSLLPESQVIFADYQSESDMDAPPPPPEEDSNEAPPPPSESDIDLYSGAVPKTRLSQAGLSSVGEGEAPPPPPPEFFYSDDEDFDELDDLLDTIPLPSLPIPSLSADANGGEISGSERSTSPVPPPPEDSESDYLPTNTTPIRPKQQQSDSSVHSGAIFTIATVPFDSPGGVDSNSDQAMNSLHSTKSVSLTIDTSSTPASPQPALTTASGEDVELSVNKKKPRPPTSPPPSWVINRSTRRQEALNSIFKRAELIGSCITLEAKPLVPERPQRPKPISQFSTLRQHSYGSTSSDRDLEVSISGTSVDKEGASSHSRESNKGHSLLHASLSESFPVGEEDQWNNDECQDKMRQTSPLPSPTEGCNNSPSLSSNQACVKAPPKLPTSKRPQQKPVDGSAPSSLTNQCFLPSATLTTTSTPAAVPTPSSTLSTSTFTSQDTKLALLLANQRHLDARQNTYTGPPIFELNIKLFAQELTRLDQDNLRDISLREFVGKAWIKQPKLAPNVNKMIDIFNMRSRWVSSEVLTVYDASNRQYTIRYFIDLAYECFRMHNFFSSFSIYSGLSLAQVFRLKTDWGKLPSSTLSRMEQLKQTFDSSRNYRAYRRLFRAGLGKPQIPHLAIVCRDCFQIEEVFANKIARAKRLQEEKEEAIAAKMAATQTSTTSPTLAMSEEKVETEKSGSTNPFADINTHLKTMVHFAKFSQQWHELRCVKRCQETPYRLPLTIYPQFTQIMHKSEERILNDEEMWVISYSVEPRTQNRV